MIFLNLVAAAAMRCQGIILFNTEQGNRDAKGTMLEISEPEGTPISRIIWMCTLLNHCMTICHACTDEMFRLKEATGSPH